MDQPRRSSRLRRGSDVGRGSERQDERRAAVSQMMAENREGLGMKVIAVMVQRYGVLPKELWDLNSISDMAAGRGLTYKEDLSRAMFESMTSNSRYRILNLTIDKDVSHRVELPNTLRQLEILARNYKFRLDLPKSLQELIFDRYCAYNQPLVLPDQLRKLVLGNRYDKLLTLPMELVELVVGSVFSHPLVLPQRLQRLSFAENSSFDHPLAIPPDLVCIEFGNAYNRPTVLPSGIEEVRIGSAFTHEISLPTTLRKIEWCCNRPIEIISEGVTEVGFSGVFNQPVVLPSTVKKVAFRASSYTHPLNLPSGLEDLSWWPTECDGLVLPDGLRKLTWGSSSNIQLPSGLKELIIETDAPLVLHEGLVTVTFDIVPRRHYDVPASVQEVIWSDYSSGRRFTHPTTLQHLVIKFSYGELDLSGHRVHKLTIAHRLIKIEQWPQGLEELAFAVDDLEHPLRVPKGCKIVGEKRPVNVIME